MRRKTQRYLITGVKDPRPQVPLLRSLEGLRLIASLGIVSIHIFPHVGLPVFLGLNLFVDMFFTISGIVIGNLYIGQITGVGDYGLFLRRRLARIYPLHLATLVFYILLGLAIAHRHLTVDMSRYAPSQIVPNLLLIHAWWHGQLAFNFVSWSISAEFFLYLIFPLIAWAVARRFGAGLAIVVALFAAAILWCHWWRGEPLYYLHWDFAWVRALPCFAFGVWLAAFGRRLAAIETARVAAPAFILVGIVALIEVAIDAPHYLLLATLQLVVATAYLADIQGRVTPMSWAPLSRRGYLTYSLYMLHVPVATVFLSFVFPRLLGEGRTGHAIAFIAAMAILFVLADLSFRKFEDPLRRRLR